MVKGEMLFTFTIVFLLVISGCGSPATPLPVPTKIPVTPLPTNTLIIPTTTTTSTPAIPLELQWETVGGGDDISREITLSCVANSEITESGVIFAAKQGSNPIKPLNSYTRFSGDFGLAVELETQPTQYAGLTLYDRLPWSFLEANFRRPWWQGFKRMDISIVPGGLHVNIYNGQQESPVESYSYKTSIPVEPFVLWARKIGGEMVFFINYVEAGRFTENGFFSNGVAYYGLNAAPDDQLILHKLSIETPVENVGNVVVVSFFDPGIQAATGDTLQFLAASHNLLFGAFVELWNFIPEQPYAEIAVNQYSLWETINLVELPQNPGDYNFCYGDLFVEFASHYGKKVHWDNIIWHGQVPDWLVRPGSEPTEWAEMIGDPSQLETNIKDYVQTIVKRYKGRVQSYSVVNEVIRDPGTATVIAHEPLRDSPWLVALGPDYIDKVFRWVDEADPDTLLFYSDYNAEGLGEKSDHVYELVSGMLDRGVPIDGVDFQMHFWDPFSHPSPEDIATNMKRLTDLGLMVSITEMDVVIHNSSGTKDELLRHQAEDYAAILQVCLSNPGCISFGTWGITDKHSWLYSPEPNSYSDLGPLLFDTIYQPKPAFYGLIDLLRP